MIRNIALNLSMAYCSWCGAGVDPEDGYRLGELPGERRAVFCRLEHVVPWSMRGPHWEPGVVDAPDAPDRCSRCDVVLGDVRLLLVRHRGEHRITDAFCGVEHLADWAKSGGRFGQP
jgi:hypothetical protein